jgi:hypothetical protein
MTWLFENPFPAIVIGALTAAILAGGWLRTGYRWLCYLMIAAILLTVASVLVERAVVTDREQVTQTLHEIAALVERNEIEAALKYAYSGSPQVRRQAAAELPLYEFTEVNIKRNLEIEVFADHKPPKATAEFNVTVVLSSKTGGFHGRVPRYVEATFFKEEDGQWRVGAYSHFEPTRGYRTDPTPGGFSEDEYP